jgi:hypothetical protein
MGDRTVDDARLGLDVNHVGARFMLAALHEGVVITAGTRETWDALVDGLATLDPDAQRAFMRAMLERYAVQGHRFTPAQM